METKEQEFEHLNETRVFHLATVENDKPHVRGILLFAADERGIIFHTGKFKDLYLQIEANPNVEICFFFQKNNTQYRIEGKLVIDNSKELIDEIYNHPSRKFLRDWGKNINDQLAVYKMTQGKISTWNMQTNFDKKVYIEF